MCKNLTENLNFIFVRAFFVMKSVVQFKHENKEIQFRTTE